jgi:hypothetical protein
MNQNKQPSNFKRAQASRIASLLLGSVFTGVLIAIAPAFAAPIAASNNNSLNKVAASAPLADAIRDNGKTAPAATPAKSQPLNPTNL